jgi:hypothetical protein
MQEINNLTSLKREYTAYIYMVFNDAVNSSDYI